MNLFGQSAGAEDAFIIASLPQAPSLINSLVSESGGGKNVANNSTLQKTGATYAQILGCTDVSASNMDWPLRDANHLQKSCLQSKSAADLVKAYTKDAANGFISRGIGAAGAIGVTSPNTHTFYPYVDGKVIAEEPISRGAQVPSVFGFSMSPSSSGFSRKLIMKHQTKTKALSTLASNAWKTKQFVLKLDTRTSSVPTSALWLDTLRRSTPCPNSRRWANMQSSVLSPRLSPTPITCAQDIAVWYQPHAIISRHGLTNLSTTQLVLGWILLHKTRSPNWVLPTQRKFLTFSVTWPLIWRAEILVIPLRQSTVSASRWLVCGRQWQIMLRLRLMTSVGHDSNLPRMERLRDWCLRTRLSPARSISRLVSYGIR